MIETQKRRRVVGRKKAGGINIETKKKTNKKRKKYNWKDKKKKH